jgi:outer membrane immunogenic protein
MPDDRARPDAFCAPGDGKARLMRWVICAVVVLAFAPSARAGDFDILRGSQPTVHWSGFYGGVQGGFASSVINFNTAASSEVGSILRETAIEKDQQISQWPVLGSQAPTTANFGAFVGYNFEWQGSVIVGLELNYNRVSIAASSTGAIDRNFTDSTNLPTGHHYFYDVKVASQSSLYMTDVATFRARAGWELNDFLPYGFIGLAVGRANYSTAATVAYSATDFVDSSNPPIPPLPDIPVTTGSEANKQDGVYAYGFATGIGTDVAVTSNVFLRGELEYIYFAPVNAIHVTMVTGRVGVGLKF